MNTLYVGRSRHIRLPKGSFLYINDDIPNIPLAQIFDPTCSSLDALKRITRQQARELADILYTAVPNGADTLTVRDGRRALASALFEADRFDLIKTSDKEVSAMLDDILFLPILRDVLCGAHPVFGLKRHTVILARLNRAEIGDFAALVLGLLLINRFPGQIVIPDFAFYARDAHISLLRQERLIAGIDSLDDLPSRLRRAALKIPDKRLSGVLYEDAVTLAYHAGLRPDPLREDNPFSNFIATAMNSDQIPR